MIYAQRLLDRLGASGHETHVVLSAYAQMVIKQELPDGLRLAKGIESHGLKSMNAPFASGSRDTRDAAKFGATQKYGAVAAGRRDDPAGEPAFLF